MTGRTGRAGLGAGALAALLLAPPAPLRAQPVAKANFVAEGSFALPAAGDGGLQRPRAIAWGPGNRVHVADDRGTIVVFSANGVYQRTYGTGLKKVVALAVDAAGRAYALDPDQKVVLVFDSTGTVVQKIGSPGGQAGQLDDPLDVAVGGNGLVYVLDKARRGVQVFSLDGTFLHDVVLPPTAKEPRALAVAPSGRIYVALKDLPNALLRLPELTVALAAVDVPAPEVASVDLRGAALKDADAVVATPTGTVIAADRETGVLWSLDGRGGAPTGTDDRLYGGSGSGRGSFKKLEDAALAGADELLLLDSEGRKIERVKLILEARRPADVAMDYPVQFQSFPPTVDQGVIASASRPGGTVWFALVGAQGKGLRVVEARMTDHVGLFGGRIRVPEVAGGAAAHAFGATVEKAGHAALNDTLLVVTEPGKNRFHVFDLRTDAHVGAFGDNFRDDRRLKDPRGIALFGDGRIAVADHGNERVAVFSPDLATLLGDFPLAKAQGVAVSPDGRLFAWDEDGVQVGVLAASGRGFESLPAPLAAGGVAALTVDAAGNVYALRRGSGRVAILDAGLKRMLARVGSQRGIESGERLTVDADGNIYATDPGKGSTVAMRWGVDLPPVGALVASWSPTAVDLAWEAVPGSFVTGYQVEGAPGEDGPWTRLTSVARPGARAQDPTVLFYRVEPRILTGSLGRPSPAAPAQHLAALAAFGDGDWARARELARIALEAVAQGAATADDATLTELAWAGFVAAHELADHPDVLAWDARLQGRVLADARGFDHHRRLADTYQKQGRLQEAMRWASAALAIPDAPRDPSAILARLIFDDAWQLGDWAAVARIGEPLVGSYGGASDAERLERLIRAQLEVGDVERARALIATAQAARSSAEQARRLRTLEFVTMAALADYANALPIAAELGSPDADLFVPFQGALARVRLETGDRSGARSALLALVTQRDATALSHPMIARSTLAVFGNLIEAGEADGARSMLDSLVAVLPADRAAVRTEVLRQADSVAAVADTRVKLGEGLAFYRDAQFRDAVRFFQAADRRTDLDVDQKLIVKELLAGSLYSFNRGDEADEVYRGVYVVDPAFDLVVHLKRIQDVYGVAAFTDEMAAHFAQLGAVR